MFSHKLVSSNIVLASLTCVNPAQTHICASLTKKCNSLQRERADSADSVSGVVSIFCLYMLTYACEGIILRIATAFRKVSFQFRFQWK